MSVRAKFKVQRIESQLYRKQRDPKGGYGDGNIIDVEMRTVVLSPVYSDDPDSENRKFWDASPAGEIKLGTINPAAWEQFELGGEYYIDFTLAGPLLGIPHDLSAMRV